MGMPSSQNGPVSKPQSAATLESDERWQLVNRIAATASFRKSPRLRNFLLFVAERGLLGRSEEINEYEIGWKVFERKDSYNTLEDSIVRSAARQLRTKLKAYFESEGRNESWLVEIPKGHYAPIFSKRDTQTPTALAELRKTKAAILRWRVVAAVLAGIMIGLGFACYRLWQTPRYTQPRTALSLASTVLAKDQPTRVVLGDYGTVLMSLISKHAFSVEEYANRSYPQSVLQQATQPPIRDIWDNLTNGLAVSFPDASIVGDIFRLSGEEGKKVIILQARQITIQDLRSGNLIFIASALSSPWIHLIEDKLNFRFHVRFDTDFSPSLPEFVNSRPEPGEKPSYPAAPTTPGYGVTYGLVARVPNLSGTGKILLIHGLRYPGSQAAGDYATDPKAAAELVRLFRANGVSELPDFEVLLRTDSIAYSHLNVKIAAWRKIGASGNPF